MLRIRLAILSLMVMALLSACTPVMDFVCGAPSCNGAPPTPAIETVTIATPSPVLTPTPVAVTAPVVIPDLTPAPVLAPAPVVTQPAINTSSLDTFDLIKLCISDALTASFDTAFNECLSRFNLVSVLADFSQPLFSYFLKLDDNVFDSIWDAVFAGQSDINTRSFSMRDSRALLLRDELVLLAETQPSAGRSGFGNAFGSMSMDGVSLVCQAVPNSNP